MKRILLALVLATLLVGPAAAVMVKLDTPTLSLGSNDVLVGRVVSLESRWDYEEEYIYTYVTLAVDRSLKGVITDRQIVLKVPGGEANGLILTVSDTPYFEKGQDVVVFVTKNDTGTPEVFGGFQGKYTIVQGRVEEAALPAMTTTT